MRYPKTHRSVVVLLFVTLLVVCGGLIVLSAPAAAQRPGGSPLRLRLKVSTSQLKKGQWTSVWAEFLDRNYEQVQNDGTRVIQFAATPRGTGSFSQQQVTVKAGAWSAATAFTSSAPGKVVLTASSEALDSDQTVLLVTPQAASFLSQLFETVAYAQEDSFELTPSKFETSTGESRAKFELNMLPARSVETDVVISTEPAATIHYKEKSYEGVAADIRLSVTGKSEPIYISSQNEGSVQVIATIKGSERRASAIAKFSAPMPDTIIFDAEPQEISPDINRIPLSVQVVDRGLFPVNSDQPRIFTFRNACDKYHLDFEPISSSNTKTAQTWVLLKDVPAGAELTVYADSPPLKPGKKTITILREIAGLRIDGPDDVTVGRAGEEYAVSFVDKDGKVVKTDRDRTVNLTATSGTFTPAQLTIPHGQSSGKVRYTSSGPAAGAQLNAASDGLDSKSKKINLVTAIYWLVISSLFGGLVGGVVRHISKDYKLERVMPRRTSDGWELGLVGRVGCSIACGLFLYLTLKLGLSGMLSWQLPAGLDVGTKLLAFFFGGIGGFAGTVVFDRLAGYLKLQPQVAN